jgi:hypothetical protein
MYIDKIFTENPSSMVVVGSNPARLKHIVAYRAGENGALRFKKTASVSSRGHLDVLREKRILAFMTHASVLPQMLFPDIVEFDCGDDVCLTVSEVVVAGVNKTFFDSRTPTFEDAENFCRYVRRCTGRRVSRKASLLGFVDKTVGKSLQRSDFLGLGDATSVEVNLAHCDFTPWNVRIADDFFLVIDFEMCRFRMPPFYDLVHFWYSDLKLLRLWADESIVEEAIQLVQSYPIEERDALRVAVRFYFGMLFLRDRLDKSLLLQLADCECLDK